MVQKRLFTQKDMAIQTGVSQSTISRTIHGPLELVTRKRKKVHRLNEKHIENRNFNSAKLLKLIKRFRPEYIVTLDEALIYLTNSGVTKFCYLRKGEEIPEEYLQSRVARRPGSPGIFPGLTICPGSCPG